jgi:hypothetical protein
VGCLGGGGASELQVDSARKKRKSQCVKFLNENDIGCTTVSWAPYTKFTESALIAYGMLIDTRACIL